MTRAFLVVALPCLLAACAPIAAVMHPTITGSLTLHNGGVATSWTPDRCISGDAGYFVGFDFVSSTGAARLRAMLDPLGAAVVRWDPGSGRPVQVLRSDMCTRLVVDATPTAWRVNDVREFAGHVELQCAAPDGASIEGRIAVDHCH